MNALIYVRVSTDKQAEKDLSLPAQLAACRQYATERGWQIVEEFTEPGVSARTADRPELKRLLRLCRRRKGINCVLVHKIDRLARNLADHAIIRSVLKRRGIRVVSVQEQFEDSISGQLVENIMAAIAEFYSANLGEEVRKGMRQKVLQGGWPHPAPRGYAWTLDLHGRKTLQEHPVDGPLIRLAFEKCARGDRSLKDLVEDLTVLGLRSSRGSALSRSHLRHILGKSFYAGRIVWQDVEIKGLHPALVSPELFERVQAVLAQRHRPAPKAHLSGFPLRGLARCAKCGGNMMAERHRRFGYYRCCRQQYRRSLCDARYCNADRVHADLQRIYRDQGHANVVDVGDPKTAAALRAMFTAVTISRDGIVGFSLRSEGRSQAA